MKETYKGILSTKGLASVYLNPNASPEFIAIANAALFDFVPTPPVVVTPYAVVSSYTNAVLTTVNIEGLDYDIYTFNENGTIEFASAGNVDFIMVAGGGASGDAIPGYASAGAGAGGFLPSGGGIGVFEATASEYSIGVGLGGTGMDGSFRGNSGQNSSITGDNSPGPVIGGGGGAGVGSGSVDDETGRNGGSGGGGGTGFHNAPGGTGTAGQGNNGAPGNTDNLIAGGGGGAGGAGSGITGGAGVESAITGTALIYAAGGDGAVPGAPNATPGTNGRGNGASGTGQPAGNASGGRGVVILRIGPLIIPGPVGYAVRVFDGSAWIEGVAKHWDGLAWQTARIADASNP